MSLHSAIWFTEAVSKFWITKYNVDCITQHRKLYMYNVHSYSAHIFPYLSITKGKCNAMKMPRQHKQMELKSSDKTKRFLKRKKRTCRKNEQQQNKYMNILKLMWDRMTVDSGRWRNDISRPDTGKTIHLQWQRSHISHFRSQSELQLVLYLASALSACAQFQFQFRIWYSVRVISEIDTIDALPKYVPNILFLSQWYRCLGNSKQYPCNELYT